MVKGTYIWDAKVEIKWNYEDEDESFNSSDYTVVAPTFEKSVFENYFIS